MYFGCNSELSMYGFCFCGVNSLNLNLVREGIILGSCFLCVLNWEIS